MFCINFSGVYNLKRKIKHLSCVTIKSREFIFSNFKISEHVLTLQIEILNKISIAIIKTNTPIQHIDNGKVGPR
jgi:hypothetical protein